MSALEIAFFYLLEYDATESKEKYVYISRNPTENAHSKMYYILLF